MHLIFVIFVYQTILLHLVHFFVRNTFNPFNQSVQVLDSDKRALMDSDDSISSDDDSDYGRMTVQTGRRRSILAPKKWCV